MNPQVLITTTLASVRSLSKRTSYPAAASRAIRCSESTVFFEQPSVMTLIFFISEQRVDELPAVEDA